MAHWIEFSLLGSYFLIAIGAYVLYFICLRYLPKTYRKYEEALKQILNKEDIEFNKKFSSYIEHNRLDIQQWKNAEEDLQKKVDKRLTKLEKLVLPK